MRSTFKALVVWFVILLLAVLNGALREFMLVPALGVPAATALSGIVLCALIIGVVFLARPWLGLANRRAALDIGAFWLLLTLAFEFGFGCFVQHKSWPEMIGAYRFENGNLWPLVLLVILVSPAIAALLGRGRCENEH